MMVALCCLLNGAVLLAANGHARTWTSAEDFEACTWDGGIDTRTHPGTVRLAKTCLLQDEQGMTHYRNVEVLGPTVWACKEFWLDSPECEGARLYWFSLGKGQPTVRVNGHALGGVAPLPSTGWWVAPVPAECLRKGLNAIVFSGAGELLIENSLYPNRSARSEDGGTTWDYDHLGPDGVENGEYLVRLRLNRYPRTGTLTSDVVDLATLWAKGQEGFGVLRPSVRVSGLRLAWRCECPPGTQIALQVRTGESPQPTAESWTPWRPVVNRRSFAPPPSHRYVQWRALLGTRRPLSTPVLQEVVLTASVEAAEDPWPKWAERLRVVEANGHRPQVSSYPFAYQPPDERLARLKELYPIEQVVASAQSELEALVALRDWVRRQWRGWQPGSTLWCPPWDALVILDMAKRESALGMCTHYSAVFTQCCLALGFTARPVILDHHCVAEVWSHQFGKWILMDTGNALDRPERNCHFEHKGVPLNALEIRRLWKEGRTAEIEVVLADGTRFPGHQLDTKVQCGFENYRRFGVPMRNTQMRTPYPGELEQGKVQYFCDAYLWWEDGPVPTESPEYGKTSCRPADFYWTLDEVGVALQPAKEPGVVRILLDTLTPNFDSFLVSFDGGESKPRPSSFTWQLHPGRNVLEAVSVNRFGRQGSPRRVVVEYAEPG